MRPLYARQQRTSINDPATIGDIPQELLRYAFIYLLPGKYDLVAPSETCRAFRPVALELMFSQLKLGKRTQVERLVFGVRLKSLVFGSGSVSITRLDIGVEFVERKTLRLLALLVAPTLSSLLLDFSISDEDEEETVLSSSDCYEILEAVFLYCHRIRNLSLLGVVFGGNTDAISPIIKERFARLQSLELSGLGDIKMFINNTPIPDLQAVKVCAEDDDDEVVDFTIVNAIASNYRTLINLNLRECCVSSTNLLKIVECCPYVEKIAFYSHHPSDLKRSDIEALASLPNLTSLDIRGYAVIKVLSSFVLLKGLKNLGMRWLEGLSDVLPIIGRNLLSFDVRYSEAEAWMAFYANCPNLQYLGDHHIAAGTVDKLNSGLRKSLKKLASFKVGSGSVRLGTEWEGYTTFEA
jgi:hypothetical protein